MLPTPKSIFQMIRCFPPVPCPKQFSYLPKKIGNNCFSGNLSNQTLDTARKKLLWSEKNQLKCKLFWSPKDTSKNRRPLENEGTFKIWSNTNLSGNKRIRYEAQDNCFLKPHNQVKIWYLLKSLLYPWRLNTHWSCWGGENPFGSCGERWVFVNCKIHRIKIIRKCFSFASLLEGNYC